MKRIKILQIAELPFDNYYMNNLIDFIDKNLFDFVFINFGLEDSTYVKAITSRGYKIYSLPPDPRRHLFRSIYRVWCIYRKERPDIVHAHLFFPSLIGLLVAKSQGLRTILTRHYSVSIHELRPRIKKIFYLAMQWIINTCADHIIAPSRAVKKCLMDLESVLEDKISLIPYGQRVERFDIKDAQIASKRHELNMDGYFTMTVIGRLFDRKGHKFLFEALSSLIGEYPKLKLYLAGDGPHRGQFEEAVRYFGIEEHVVFLGWRHDILEIIAASDLIVHPSLEEALPSAVIESLMLKKVIIATDVGGIRDILDDGRYGIIIQPGNSEELRAAIKYAINNYDALSRAAQQGVDYLLSYMGAEKVAKQHESLYRKMIGI
jgi:glycosyltransferase involved in cell wall biosynthesis